MYVPLFLCQAPLYPPHPDVEPRAGVLRLRGEAGARLPSLLPPSQGQRQVQPSRAPAKSLASPGWGNNAWQQGDGGGAPLQAQPPFSVSLNLQTFLSSYPEIRFNVKPNLFFFLKLDVQRPKKNKP